MYYAVGADLSTAFINRSKSAFAPSQGPRRVLSGCWRIMRGMLGQRSAAALATTLRGRRGAALCQLSRKAPARHCGRVLMLPMDRILPEF